MPGAGKKRGKIDKKNGAGPAQEQPAAVEAFDGPPPAGRGRDPTNAPGASRDVSAARSAAGPSRDPARDPQPLVLNRNVDFAGNAYNLLNPVSHKLFWSLRFLFKVL